MGRLVVLVGLIAWVSGGALASAQQNSEQDFARWLEAFKQRMVTEQRFPRTFLDDALKGAVYRADVVKSDRNQPEAKLTQADYLNRVVTDRRIAQGRSRLRAHRDLLDRVEKQFGVPARFLVAFWGIESSYGGNTGRFEVIPSLATLAFDLRRRKFFERQLVEVLSLLRNGDLPGADVKGSWAGGMGHMQFIPTSYSRFAVDFDGDQRKDLWNSLPDVFASAAHYLSSNGWETGETWGRPVSIGEKACQDRCASLARAKSAFTEDQWRAMGVEVRRSFGTGVPKTEGRPTIGPARLLLFDGHTDKGYLVGRNFEVILRWNRSNHYAVAVGVLSDRIHGP